MGDEEYEYAAEEGEADENDPDYLAKNPPAKVVDPKAYFQTGEHEGKWSEYDDRGVPLKNAKKKKLAKKEKDAVEAEYTAHKKKYDQYMADVGTWEQAKIDAEAALETTDMIRWAFRQLGEDKNEPIEVDQLGELFDLMGWTLGKGELSAIKKDSAKVSVDSMLDLESLRSYVNKDLPNCILDVRLSSSAINKFDVDQLYSPRTWRLLAQDDASPRGDKKKKKKDSSSPRASTSPRASMAPDSPRGGKRKSEKEPKSPRDSPRSSVRKDRKSVKGGDDETSPRSRKSVKAADDDGSPRGKEKKDKKDKKEKKTKSSSSSSSSQSSEEEDAKNVEKPASIATGETSAASAATAGTAARTASGPTTLTSTAPAVSAAPASRAAPVADANIVEEYRKRISKLYEEHNPSKVADVDKFLGKSVGCEHKLYIMICDKYKVTAEPEYKGPGPGS
eukprot:gnl/MRDRNA2_/MRDRNA2_89896_c0_seq1.p1 gnl/MRDRNA2_/MRDRNA2_89896_c0~~gnl/MRDRNA2_/MRDRNA2_89896_c0_seq1.p1  ORF type:complete len:448 (-),score=123.21 gnl/MRDRNA2_/MRDRNA2_89896_c0_seq1:34-1377(-)